ncbi:MAG: hypothetical protein HZA28_08165 [Candidatus Omnitrophica bacterium]|nr:hypothetical protein [Candidatus Omnitrophota bacterium]
MRKIPLEIVLKYWRGKDRQSEKEIYQTLKPLHLRQPLLMRYLMVADQDALNEEEHQMLYYLGSLAVQVMVEEFLQIREVTAEQWERVRFENLQSLERVETKEDPEIFKDFMDEMMSTHHQMDLFAFVGYALLNDSTLKDSIRPENVWRLFAHLKITIDCLDEAAMPLLN